MTKYKMATGFQHNMSKNGGVCILVKNNITYWCLEVVTNSHTRKPREEKNGDAADDGILAV
jgi:hypothetical protein